MENFNIKHAEVLYLRFCAIYDHKFVKGYHDDDFKALWANEWCSGLAGVNLLAIKDALEYCKKNLEWPPGIAEFVKICESLCGVPSLEDSFKSALKKDFNHPIVLMCYEKVGSWAMKNNSERELHIKFQAAYSESLNKFRLNSSSEWKQLESFNEKPKELSAPEKIPSLHEMKLFSARIAEHRKIAADEKEKYGAISCREFDERKINPRLRTFDKNIYAEYREYLLSIPEEMVLTLPINYIYDRNRFILVKEVSLSKESTYTNANPKGFKDNSTTGFYEGNKGVWGGY